MPNAADLYSGIIAPQGGLYKPGAPVMLPPQGMNANAALAQALMDPTGLGPDSGALSGMLDDPIYSGQDIPHASGTTLVAKDQTRLPARPKGNMFAYGEPSNNAPTSASAEIANVLIHGGANPLQKGLGAPVGSAPEGDPWGSVRLGAAPMNKSGMVTGNKGLGTLGNPAVYSQPTKPAISAYQAALQRAAVQHKTTPEAIHIQLMAQQNKSAPAPTTADMVSGNGPQLAQTAGEKANQQMTHGIFGNTHGSV